MENLTVLDAPVANRVRYAGFLLRFVALMVDTIVVDIVGYIIFAIFGLSMFQFNNFDAANMDWTPLVRVWILLIVFDWLYFALMESSVNQATLGKWRSGYR